MTDQYLHTILQSSRRVLRGRIANDPQAEVGIDLFGILVQVVQNHIH